MSAAAICEVCDRHPWAGHKLDCPNRLSTPPADDVREAVAKAVCAADEPTLDYERKWPSETDEIFHGEGWRYYLGIADRLIATGIPAAAALATAAEVRPLGTVADAARLEYTVAAISDNGAITSLSGESTVVRDHLRGDLELYRQQQVEAGCDPERIIIAQRPIPKWVRS